MSAEEEKAGPVSADEDSADPSTEEAAPEATSDDGDDAPRTARKERIDLKPDSSDRDSAKVKPKDPKGTKDGKPPPNPAQMSWKTMIYAFIATAIIFLLIDPSARNTCGLTLATGLDPAIGFGGLLPVLTLLLAGNLMAIFSMGVRQYVIDWADTARVQHLSRWLNKIKMDAYRSKSSQQTDQATELQRKYAGEMWGMQKSQFKAMGFTFLPVIAVFAWLGIFMLSASYPVFSVPWAEQVYLQQQTVIFPAWILLYGLVSLPVSMVLQKILKYFSFKKQLEALEGGEAA